MSEDIGRLRTIADYQFGAGAGEALFPTEENVTVRTTTTGRPQQVLANAGRVVSYGTDGRFTLGLTGGKRLQGTFESPRLRVALGEESVPFVSEGKNAFAKFVRDVDPEVRPGDELCVVGPGDRLLGVGRAELGATAMAEFETGVAVSLRESIGR